jgi:hypothetical protein
MNPTTKVVEVVRIEDLKPLKVLYKKAIRGKCEIFTYKGKEILTSYAKYLIEYMETWKSI